MRINIKKVALISIVIVLGIVWIITTIKNRQEAEAKNAEASWYYFQNEKIYIGEQLCTFAGKDSASGKKAFKCPDGKIYVHKDWH